MEQLNDDRMSENNMILSITIIIKKLKLKMVTKTQNVGSQI